MKRYTLLPATLLLILFLATAPAVAQTVAVADADVVADTEAIAATDTDGPAVQPGFPALRKPMPALVYPVKAEQFQIEGRVLVEYTVNKRGRAKDVRILDGPGGGCGEEVKRVLRAARFQPILDADGHPVETRFHSAFDFKLN